MFRILNNSKRSFKQHQGNGWCNSKSFVVAYLSCFLSVIVYTAASYFLYNFNRVSSGLLSRARLPRVTRRIYARVVAEFFRLAFPGTHHRRYRTLATHFPHGVYFHGRERHVRPRRRKVSAFPEGFAGTIWPRHVADADKRISRPGAKKEERTTNVNPTYSMISSRIRLSPPFFYDRWTLLEQLPPVVGTGINSGLIYDVRNAQPFVTGVPSMRNVKSQMQPASGTDWENAGCPKRLLAIEISKFALIHAAF